MSMKRILGRGFVEKKFANIPDSAVGAIGRANIPLAFKVKVPEFLMDMFRDWGVILEPQDLYTEFYAPANFKKADGSAVDIKENADLNTKFLNYYRFLSNFHSKLEKQGIMPEQLAYLLPFGIFVTFDWHTTLEALAGFLEDNLESIIPERKEVAHALLAHFKENFPSTASAFLAEFDKNRPS